MLSVQIKHGQQKVETMLFLVSHFTRNCLH